MPILALPLSTWEQIMDHCSKHPVGKLFVAHTKVGSPQYSMKQEGPPRMLAPCCKRGVGTETLQVRTALSVALAKLLL